MNTETYLLGDLYSLHIEHRNTRRRALIVVHSSTPITRLN